MEEAYWRQKSRCKWLIEGERNTKVFQAMARKKQTRAKIFQIRENGVLMNDPDEIGNSAMNYFKKLLLEPEDIIACHNLYFIPQIVTEEDNAWLCREPTMEEVKTTVFGLNSDSVAGPDGFNAHFYQTCWEFIQDDVFAAVVDFFHGVTLPRSFKATNVVLIPKKENPEEWKDYRPISLCNVSYKILSKVLNDRLAIILPKIVSPSQSGFVKGRLIGDNILLAQEMVYNLGVRRGKQNTILKLDMEKAYDRMDWEFIYQMLSKFGFCPSWINLIKACIEECYFSILVNGETNGFFKSAHGIRQGDPISPALFIIAAEFLSRGLESLYRENPNMEFSTGGGLMVTHLAYADDCIIFINGHKDNMLLLKKFLNLYEMVSGQKVNERKSCFLTGNSVDPHFIHDIKEVTGFERGQFPITYLGAPLFRGPPISAYFRDWITKVKGLIYGWENKYLNFGGRLTLIKSVLCAIPIYLCQILKPPVVVIEELERMFAKFLWGTTETRRKKHWRSWDKVCRPYEEGGLGVRSLASMIQTFGMKLWWRMRSQDSLWARYMLHRYGKRKDIMTIKSWESSGWKRLIDIAPKAQPHIFWSIRNGNAFFWQDHWFGDESLRARGLHNNNMNEKVSDYWRNGEWDVQKVNATLANETAQQVLQIRIRNDGNDLIAWKLEVDGVFSTKSARRVFRTRLPRSNILDSLWHKFITPNISIFNWRLALDLIPTDRYMTKHGYDIVSKCHCCRDIETEDHLFWSSGLAQSIWSFFFNLFHIRRPRELEWNNIHAYWRGSHGRLKYGHIRTLIPTLVLWFIWAARNDARHRDIPMNKNKIIDKVRNYICDLFSQVPKRSVAWQGDDLVAKLWGIKLTKSKEKKTQKVVWAKPQLGYVKLNTDGCSKGNPGAAGGGGILRDHQGHCLWAFHLSLNPSTNVEAEILSIHRGLQICQEQGIQNIIIETDAMVAIKIIEKKSGGNWKYISQIHDIRTWLHNLNGRMVHIFREGNGVADYLANEACEHRISETLDENQLSRHVLTRIKMDKQGWPNFRFPRQTL